MEEAVAYCTSGARLTRIASIQVDENQVRVSIYDNGKGRVTLDLHHYFKMGGAYYAANEKVIEIPEQAWGHLREAIEVAMMTNAGRKATNNEGRG